MSHTFSAAGSIRVRVLSILGVLAVGYLLLLAMVQFTAAVTHRRLEKVSTSLFPAALSIREAESAFVQLQKSYKDAVLLEDPNALVEAGHKAANVAEALGALRAQVYGSGELMGESEALLDRFDSIRSRSQVTYSAMLAGKDNLTPGLQAQAAALAVDDGTFITSMQNFDRSVAAQVGTECGAIDSLTIRSRFIGLFMLLVALIGCGGAWWVLQYKLAIPLGRLAQRMEDIAKGDGDLTDRVEVHGHNEIDEVGRWFNVFIERIEQIVIRVTRNSGALAVAARDLAEIARETASQTALQQEQATGITASMHDISTAVEQISQTTHAAAVNARRAEQNAHAGGETIHATVLTIERVRAAKQATALKVEELGSSIQAIGKIVQLIDDIANQTSLLALNASIESARAGEHGRGFAVVAVEVRRLAERTSKATREIDHTVRAIQDGATEVVEAIRTGLTQVEGGVLSARSAGDALTSIIQGSESVQRMVSEIASASSEQAAASLSVNTNLHEIARISVRTTGSSARAVHACDHLSALANDLNALVGSFKVRDTTQFA